MLLHTVACCELQMFSRWKTSSHHVGLGYQISDGRCKVKQKPFQSFEGHSSDSTSVFWGGALNFQTQIGRQPPQHPKTSWPFEVDFVFWCLVATIHVNGVNERNLRPWLPSEFTNRQNESFCCGKRPDLFRKCAISQKRFWTDTLRLVSADSFLGSEAYRNKCLVSCWFRHAFRLRSLEIRRLQKLMLYCARMFRQDAFQHVSRKISPENSLGPKA